ncbi:probable prolyl 4-hydroxylase 4 isoform X2 [Magnolia sinica]|uniref:probable prolyl 4-hydroxylase 4 isoform X2 n=1 Tax=Magnolia sinica TaxID=86752 RepID=UPI00265AE3F8|nr:probable prolyl 4-hydroxylase 4 isoform X2 [Magnolia sinica]
MIRSRVRVFLLSIWLLFHESSSTSHSSSSLTISSNRVEQISWKPRAFVYEGFLTDEECDHMISIDMVVARIEDKIAAWTFLPVENGEDIQVLRYEHGQKYDPHYDYFSDKVNIVRGGHRIATVLMYLSNVTKGGETVFPSAEGESPHKDEDLSECARKGIAVKPKRGNALLFFNLKANGTPDPLSLHAGCPVIEGEKWSATKWIHVSSFDKIIDAGDCKDENEHCERWAALGECWKNQEYMVGSTEVPGACRRSCKVC